LPSIKATGWSGLPPLTAERPCIPKNMPVRTAASACRLLPPAYFRSTTPMAPVPNATVWGRGCTSRRISWCPTRAFLCAKAPLLPGPTAARFTTLTCWTHWRNIMISTSICRFPICRKKSARFCCMDRERNRSNFTLTVRTNATSSTAPLKASSGSWSAAGGKPRPPASAATWPATSTCGPAKPAAARA